MKKAIALLDCNNFYASCERVFDAAAKYKPVVILSNNDGCVVARSEEAKRIGVTMGIPAFKVESLLEQHEAQIFSSNYALYGDMSHRIMNLLENFTPDVEVYSIDEAFMNLQTRRQSFEDLAYTIREKIYQWTGIPVSIGIGQTKVLAKLANRRAKSHCARSGVFDMCDSLQTETVLTETPVENVWGIGARSAAKLKAASIHTAWELAQAEQSLVRKLLTVVGARIALELRGQSCLPLETVNAKRYSITCSRTFGEIVSNPVEVGEAVRHFLAKAGEKMRRAQLAAHAVTVFIGTDRFRPEPEAYDNAGTYSSIYATDDYQEMRCWAEDVLKRIFRAGFGYRRAGVILSGLVPSKHLTKRMFDEQKFCRRHNLMKAVDEINRKFGRDTIKFGTSYSNKWQMKQLYRSPCYTTDWNDLLRIA